LQHGAARLDAAGADAGGDVLLEGLVEGAALAAVEGEHRLILGDAAERLRDHARRNAGALRFARKIINEAVEITAALGGGSGGGGKGNGGERSGENGSEAEFHCDPF